MEINADEMLKRALGDGLRGAIKSQMSTVYNSPFSKLVEASIASHSQGFREILDEALKACLNDKDFRQEIVVAIRHTLAKTLVARFGGELEKQVNVLKSDPPTRARITLAIEDIVASKAT